MLLKVQTIDQCNQFFSAPTLHPLVSVCRPNCTAGHSLIQLSFYSVWLLEACAHCPVCGRRPYDFGDATLLFLSPGRVLNCAAWCDSGNCRMLAFHPALLAGTPLGAHISDYTFFRYRTDEALHVSAREKAVIQACLDHVGQELSWGVDAFSHRLLVGRIELLLNYGARFYHRQFISRHEVQPPLAERAEALLIHYFLCGQVRLKGSPDVDFCARSLQMSAAYFDDMLKYETGYRLPQYLQTLRLRLACRLLRTSARSVADIAALLGYPSEPCFTRLFRLAQGCDPQAYRAAN